MTEESQTVVENKEVNQIVENSVQNETVSKEAYEQVKADMHKFKGRYKENEDKLSDMQSKLEQMETTSLEEKKNYKELWEKSSERERVAKEEATAIKESYLSDRRLSEIEKEAIAQGMDDVGLDFLKSGALPTDAVITETTSTGRVNVLGAKECIEDLKRKWGDRFFPSQKAPNINFSNPGNSNLQDQALTGKDMLKLQKENPLIYREKLQQIRSGKLKLQGA